MNSTINQLNLMLKMKLQNFGHLMRRTDLLEKTLNAGKDWRQEEMGTTEDEMVGWHQQLNGQEQAPQVGDGEGSLACCSSWGGKSWTWLSDWTEALYRKSLQTSDLNTWGPYPRDKTHQIHVSDFNIHTFFTLGKTFWYWLSVRFCKLERFRILNST